ncbi:MAG: hypothetical protein ACI8W8_004772 [Rhodothermales bacterium]|jgi:hypothetical protein
MPLADQCRPIAALLKHGRHEGLFEKQIDLIAAIYVVIHAESLLELARQQAHARHHTSGRGYVRVGEHRPFVGESVQGWRRDLRLAELGQIRIAHIVGQSCPEGRVTDVQRPTQDILIKAMVDMPLGKSKATPGVGRSHRHWRGYPSAWSSMRRRVRQA